METVSKIFSRISPESPGNGTRADVLPRTLALTWCFLVGVAGFEPAASSSRSKSGGYALIWAEPRRGPLPLTCANVLSGSHCVGPGLDTLAPGLAPGRGQPGIVGILVAACEVSERSLIPCL